MPSSDLDHNYYTRNPSSSSSTHHPSDAVAATSRQRPDRISPSSISISSSHSLSNSASHAPPHALYAQEPLRSPKKLVISTGVQSASYRTFSDRTSSALSAASGVEGNHSPDPRDFYRPYTDHIETLRPDIFVDQKPDRMASAATQRMPMPPTARPTNGASSRYAPLASRNAPKTPSHRTASAPLGSSAPLAGVRSNPTLYGASRSQSPSLKDLVNRFEQNKEEAVPSSARPRRPPASATSPVASLQHQPAASIPPGKQATKSGKWNAPPVSKPHRLSQRKKFMGEDTISSAPASRPSKGDRSKAAVVSNPYASLSMTNLETSQTAPIRRPLFGEVLSAIPGSPDPGYGIPGHHQRRGSDGSMHTPNPMFPRKPKPGIHVSPSSPTAWYLGLTPSLDGINIGKDGALAAPPGHRRTRSAFAGNTSTITEQQGGVEPPSTSKAPPEATANAEPTSPTSKRNSQSRIPLSTRRRSNPSETGNSPPSTRTNSALDGPALHINTPLKGQSSLPKPTRKPLSPARSPPSTPTRISSRRSDASPVPNSLPSPSLKAYISVAPPKKSPPLRSSRPRLQVSSASTSGARPKPADGVGSSRANAAHGKEHLQPKERKSPHKKIPELGGVDFAARRDKIQRAFTKSMKETEDKEKEQAAEKRRLAREKEFADDPDAADSGDVSAVTGQQDVINVAQHQGAPSQPSEDHSHPESVRAKVETGLTVNTHLPMPDAPRTDNSATTLEYDNDDSPTLGIPGSFHHYRSFNAPPATSPLPLAGVGSIVTPIDAEVQTEIPRPTSVAPPRPLETESATPDEETPHEETRLREPSSDNASHTDFEDFDDRESIQIMLGATPISANVAENHSWDDDFSEVVRNGVRQSLESYGSFVRDRLPANTGGQNAPARRPDVALPYALNTLLSPSFTASASDRSPQPWGSDYNQTPRTGRSTLDSDAYSTINRVLQHYHDPDLVSPEMMHDFQQHILTQSPELARQGGWDPKRVTQLYLQELARNRFVNHKFSPSLSKIGNAAESPQASEAQTEEPVTEIDCGESEDHSSSEGKSDHGTEHVALTRDALTVNGADLPANRASLQNLDDFINNSPSIMDWIHPQAEIVDSPVAKWAPDTPYKPSPPPKDLSPNIHDLPDRDGAETPRISVEGKPVLPEIKSSGLGLGVTILIDSPVGPTLRAPPPLPNYSPPPPPSLTTDTQFTPEASSESFIRSPPSPSVYSNNPPSSIFPSVFPNGISKGVPTRSSADTSITQTTSTLTAQSTKHTSVSQLQESTQSRKNSDIASIDTNGKAVSPSVEQKRLTKRRHIVKELVDTEHSFHQDMTVTEEIYKKTANACKGVTPEDIKVLFGNSELIVAFSRDFLHSLRQAASSVYETPRKERSSSSAPQSQRNSVATSESDDILNRSSINGIDLSDDEKDRKTFIGEAFGQHMARMEKVYGDYLKNHDAANKRLQLLQAQPPVQVWLAECRENADDLTTAWSLDSLLVKPVQRILKYPLLLHQLVETTPENHPDFTALDVAVREMTATSRRINELKKRVDLLEKAVGRKRKESDVRAGLSNAIGRRAEKLRQQVGLSGYVEDSEYKKIAERFGSHFFHIQVVMRDVEMYTTDVQTYVEKFNEFVMSIEELIDVSQSPYPELESRWRKFAMTMREMGTTALTEHKSAVRKSVIEPMITLLKLHDGPQRIMQKRDKRLMDYARYKAVKDRGEKPDKRTQEKGDQFMALNDTLKDELPKLFSLTGKLMEACLGTYVQIQLSWQTIWQQKIKSILDEHQVPNRISEIVEQFSGDFAYTEAQVLSLGVCNGSILVDSINFLSPQATVNGSDDHSSSRRPPSNRLRTSSLNSDVSPSLPTPDFGGHRHSGGFVFSPIDSTVSPLHATPIYMANRAASYAMSSRAPSTPDTSNGYSINTPNTSITAARPSTGGRSNDAPLIRPKLDTGNSLRPSSGSTFSHDGLRTASPARYSGLFSSAMPMDDSRDASRPESPNVPLNFNVLFLAASLFEFNIDKQRKEAGYPYLTYVSGEIFDVIAEKGELWLAKNQDDPTSQIGWIWCKHFAKLISGSS
ncbi:MAG: hypothetical protein M1829_005405 [Trizodia sp. TS-e1964]|nr:MAG: hypothetical protein M1829_005405 [Trizodia sp. TS-e1964]